MIVPGTTYLITRRCAQRQFLLRPSRTTNQVLEYVLALAARRAGVKLHAACVLSNHVHLVLSDPRARLPDFEQYLDSIVARAMNAVLGRRESFWDPRGYSAVALASPADIVAKTAYALANPSASGLVRRNREWPGVWLGPERIGRGPKVVARPQRFFKASGAMPVRAPLELSAPPGFNSAEDFRSQVEVALAELEARHAREHPTVLGAARVRAQSPWSRPAGEEPLRRLNPRIAAGDGRARIEAIRHLKAFLVEYREAWESWVAGSRGVLFPFGTYAMRVTHGAACLDSC